MIRVARKPRETVGEIERPRIGASRIIPRSRSYVEQRVRNGRVENSSSIKILCRTKGQELCRTLCDIKSTSPNQNLPAFTCSSTSSKAGESKRTCTCTCDRPTDKNPRRTFNVRRAHSTVTATALPRCFFQMQNAN